MDTGDMFIVGVTDLTTAAQKYSQPISAASLRTGFLAQGAQDIRSFPAGAPGAVLGCGHMTRAGVTEILCLRYSKTIIGMAVYLNGCIQPERRRRQDQPGASGHRRLTSHDRSRREKGGG